MIISASRRTDIPNYYSNWFYKRIDAKMVQVRNPIYAHQVSEVSLSPDVVDCIIFWTKNPAPMLARLGELSEYNYYFQFTLNAYENDVEFNVPPYEEVIETFIKLSKKIGKEKVIWRYDPILLNTKYTMEFHFDRFKKIACALSGYTEKCIFSFLDSYRNIIKSLNKLDVKPISTFDKNFIAEKLKKIADENDLLLEACGEDIDLAKYGIGHAQCIDDGLINRIAGGEIKVGKDKSQRLECGCRASTDIGLYNTCRNGCLYCYANHSQKIVSANSGKYDVDSPLLCGIATDDDIVNVRKDKSNIKNKQHKEQISIEGF